MGIGIESNNDEELSNAGKKFIETLLLVKESCQDEKYKALITMLLFLDSEKGISYMTEFKEKYPNHEFIPLIELDEISELYNNHEYQKCIELTQIWQEKYKHIISPYGWKLIMEGYNLISLCYFALNDKEKTLQCVELIEKEAPTYYNIGYLKKIIIYLR